MARTVKVGDREYTVEPFNGRKAILAGRMVARIAKKVPGLLEHDAQFQRAYADANAIRVTRAMALGIDGWRERLADVTDEQWEAIGGVLVIPQPPTFELRLASLFTEAFETAEEEVLKLLALAIVPNGDLADAAKTGDVKELLLDRADQLLDGGTLSELVDLAGEVAEQVREELQAGGGGLGKLRALWASSQSETKSSDSESSPSDTEPQPAASQTETDLDPARETGTTPVGISTPPGSSTDSPPPTDGTTSESSTGPRGVSLSPSATA